MEETTFQRMSRAYAEPIKCFDVADYRVVNLVALGMRQGMALALASPEWAYAVAREDWSETANNPRIFFPNPEAYTFSHRLTGAAAWARMFPIIAVDEPPQE